MTTEIQEIIFALDRPIAQYRPFHAHSNGPADAGLRSAEVERRDDGGKRGHGGRNLTVEIIPVAHPSCAALAINQSMTQKSNGVTEPSRRSRDEIRFQGEIPIDINFSRISQGRGRR